MVDFGDYYCTATEDAFTRYYERQKRLNVERAESEALKFRKRLEDERLENHQRLNMLFGRYP